MKIIHITDTHFRENPPACRSDNYLQTALAKFDAALSLRQQTNGIILHTGDFGDANPMTEYVKTNIIELMQERGANSNNFFTIFGQHDLENHSLRSYQRTSLYLMHALGLLTILPITPQESTHVGNDIALYACHYGQEPPPALDARDYNRKRILLIHKLFIPGLKPSPLIFNGASSAKFFANRQQNFYAILSGDNHSRFMFKTRAGVLFINGGSMMRTAIDEVENVPQYTLIDTDTDDCQLYEFPIRNDVFNAEYIESYRENARLNELTESMNVDVEDINFVENMRGDLERNPASESVRGKIFQSFEEE